MVLKTMHHTDETHLVFIIKCVLNPFCKLHRFIVAPGIVVHKSTKKLNT